MFCPSCSCEFRSGFARCASCDVDLVESLESTGSGKRRAAEAQIPPGLLPMVDYCGFLDLGEARSARDRVMEQECVAEILIRQVADEETRGGYVEEFWLRVDARKARQVAALLGQELAEPPAKDDQVQCGKCGQQVQQEESFCPSCGTRFEDAR